MKSNKSVWKKIKFYFTDWKSLIERNRYYKLSSDEVIFAKQMTFPLTVWQGRRVLPLLYVAGVRSTRSDSQASPSLFSMWGAGAPRQGSGYSVPASGHTVLSRPGQHPAQRCQAKRAAASAQLEATTCKCGSGGFRQMGRKLAFPFLLLFMAPW